MKHSYSKITALTLALLSMATANANDNDRLPTAEELEAATDRTPGGSQEELIAHSLDNIDNLAAQGGAATSEILDTSSVPALHEAFSHTVLLLIGNPRVDDPWSRVITSQEEWEEFFRAPLAYTDFFDGNHPVVPEFDFEEYQILTGGIGIKYSNQLGAEHILSVERVTQSDTEIIVHVLVVAPSFDCPTSPSDSGFPSYPSTTVLVKKTDKPFRFEVSNLTNQCGQ